MTTWRTLAGCLQKSLGLKHNLLAITFSDEVTAGIPRFEGQMPEPGGDGRIA